MKVQARSHNGKLALSEYHKDKLSEDLKENEGAFYEIKRLSPESKGQRKFLHGAVYPLWAYLDGNNYTESNVITLYHEYAKKEFNGEFIMIDGKRGKIGKSTKGMLTEFIEKVILYLEENYGIDRTQVLDSNHYKEWLLKWEHFEDDSEDYIQYLIKLNRLK